ncbi:probable xyloglucan galactosyltransferase GT17 [Phoenix dactylifera]|uniref:Probable xyloglucan galactosyltransferase GT17 n=1 Tax=Phoenix dactylifera TaxID=42345 RepID=A0A8B7CG10_PHODC|nr:probable xyloglucan galactosyltransferase GT17 [Phoenix dactylifera]
MAFRAKDKDKHSLLLFSFPKDKALNSILAKAKYLLYILLFFSLWLFLLFLCFPPSPDLSPSSATAGGGGRGDDDLPRPPEKCDPDIAPFYIYDLPTRFNLALLRRCRSLNMYTDMCPHVAHRGLGQPVPHPLSSSGGDAASPSWYATHQFIAEMIFHARAERHPCRTLDPSSAFLFYVPFYAGLYTSSVFRESDRAVRDALAVDLAAHISAHASFRRGHGRDHFLALGRTAWDLMRSDAASSRDFGANRLLVLPEVLNMSVLTVERHPWDGRNQFAIPYPSYFHPFSADEVAAWQAEVRRSKRSYLFTFVGGPRNATDKAAVRAEILRQCGASDRCLRVECEPGSPRCHGPDRVLAVMKQAEFCLQPPGDSFTRRSVFDSVLAGCVPVFFSEHTAYTQYRWYVPSRAEEWSVFLGPDRSGRIGEELSRIPKEAVERMRETVIDMIPRVTYAHPNASRSALGFRDAVDVALVELTKHVRSTLHKT